MKLIDIKEVKMTPSVTLNQENIDEVLVGFEIECVISMENRKFPERFERDGIYYHMNAQHQFLKFELLKIPEIKSLIHDVVEDGSLEIQTSTELATEIITKPIPYAQCMQSLALIIKILKERFQMRTDKWCSLHVNMSCSGTRTNKIDLLKLVTFLGEKHFLNMFNRIGNEYAHEIHSIFNTILPEEITPSTWIIDRLKNRQPQLFKFVTKFFSINPNKLKNGYLEYRIIGGKNYEMDLHKIELAVSHFAHVMLIASSDNYEEEYNKKLVNILNKLIDKKYDNLDVLSKLEQEVLNIIIKHNPSAKNNLQRFNRHDLIKFILQHYDSNILKKVPVTNRSSVANLIAELQSQYGNSRKSEQLNDIEFIKKIVKKFGKKENWNDEKIGNNLSDAMVYLYNTIPYDEDKYLQQYPNIINNLSDYEFTRLQHIINNAIEQKLITGHVLTMLIRFKHLLLQFRQIT